MKKAQRIVNGAMQERLQVEECWRISPIEKFGAHHQDVPFNEKLALANGRRCHKSQHNVAQRTSAIEREML